MICVPRYKRAASRHDEGAQEVHGERVRVFAAATVTLAPSARRARAFSPSARDITPFWFGCRAPRATSIVPMVCREFRADLTALILDPATTDGVDHMPGSDSKMRPGPGQPGQPLTVLMRVSIESVWEV